MMDMDLWETTWALPLLEVEIRGKPQPQGAIRHLGKGRPSIHANQETLLPWREVVQHTVEQSMLRVGGTWPEKGPVSVTCVFTWKKPQAAPKTRRTWPITRPDVDKLARAILDSLVFAGAIGDDSQVVLLVARKVYPQEDPQALPVPGVKIELRTLLS